MLVGLGDDGIGPWPEGEAFVGADAGIVGSAELRASSASRKERAFLFRCQAAMARLLHCRGPGQLARFTQICSNSSAYMRQSVSLSTKQTSSKHCRSVGVVEHIEVVALLGAAIDEADRGDGVGQICSKVALRLVKHLTAHRLRLWFDTR